VSWLRRNAALLVLYDRKAGAISGSRKDGDALEERTAR